MHLDYSWRVSEEEFPAAGGPEEKLRFVLNYAVLAPSGHNTQPWLFRLSGNEVELYADRTRGLAVVDPEDRALIISCGAALFYLRTALRYFGYAAGEVEPFPNPEDPDLLARVRLGREQEATEEEQQLFRAIPNRHSNRQAFEDRQVPGRLLSALQAAAWEEGGWLQLAEDAETKHKIAELVSEGDRIQLADKWFRRELAAWIHSNRSRSRDGMPGYAHGFGDLVSYVGPLVIRTFDMGSGQAAKDRQLAEGSPVLAVLGTEDDTPTDWLVPGKPWQGCCCGRRQKASRRRSEPAHRGLRAATPAARRHRKTGIPTASVAHGLRSRSQAHTSADRGGGPHRLIFYAPLEETGKEADR